MAVNRYGLHTASFVHGGGTLSINQVGAASLDTGRDVTDFIPGGALDRAATILAAGAPTARITTHDLTTVFGVVSPSIGLKCTGSCIFRGQQRSDGGAFSGGANNITYTATQGFLYPDRLSVAGNGPAVLDLMFAPTWDGTNDPFADASGATLSTTPAFSSAFYLGAVYADSALVEGVTSMTVDFGIQYSRTIADGHVYPKTGHIIRRTPVMTFTCLKLDNVISSLLSMFHNAKDDIKFYFRKGVSGGARVADATTQHCLIHASFTGTGPDSIGVSGEDDYTVSISVRPTVALTVSVASAIP